MRCSSTNIFKRNKEKPKKKKKESSFSGGRLVVSRFSRYYLIQKQLDKLSKNIAKPGGLDLDTNIRRHLSLLDFLFFQNDYNRLNTI
jgi:hypothetical protein